MLVAGILGISIGTFISAHFRPKYRTIDPLIIGVGLLLAGVFLFIGFYSVASSILASLVLIFFGTTFACLNWAVVVDMTLYVIPAPLRSTATGMQTAIAHGFGDAGSPYIIGLIADSLRDKRNDEIAGYSNVTTSCSGNAHDATERFISKQNALWVTVAMTFLSAIIFLIVSKFVVDDKRKAEGDPNLEDHPGQANAGIKTEKIK